MSQTFTTGTNITGRNSPLRLCSSPLRSFPFSVCVVFIPRFDPRGPDSLRISDHTPLPLQLLRERELLWEVQGRQARVCNDAALSRHLHPSLLSSVCGRGCVRVCVHTGKHWNLHATSCYIVLSIIWVLQSCSVNRLLSTFTQEEIDCFTFQYKRLLQVTPFFYYLYLWI